MLEIRWELATTDRVIDFSSGNLTIRGARGAATSQQAMMVFPSIVSMLDNVRVFLTASAPSRGTDLLVAIGSSFRPTIERVSRGRFAVAVGGVEIETVEQAELARAVWDSVQAVLSVNRDAAGANTADLASAEAQFASAFGRR
jgi:hypothetical protein